MNYRLEPEEYFVEITHEVDGISRWMWRNGDNSGDAIAKEWSQIRDAILKHTPGRDIIVQAGGSCGMYPRLWSNYFKIVHTFEPIDNNFKVLCLNCPSGDIHKHHCALGDSNEPIMMCGGYESKDGRTYKNVKITPENSNRNVGMYWVEKPFAEGAYQLMLDQLQFTKLDAMQLDVELYEIHVLRGAVETIKRCSPTICVENYNEKIGRFLGGLGYVIADKAWNDTVLVRR